MSSLRRPSLQFAGQQGVEDRAGIDRVAVPVRGEGDAVDLQVGPGVDLDDRGRGSAQRRTEGADRGTVRAAEVPGVRAVADPVTGVVHEPMVVAAEQYEIVDVRRSPAQPRPHMMGVQMTGVVAAGEAAATTIRGVARGERSDLGR
ncbi:MULTISPECIES: hypothetical protein [unclassified Pseudonocardia]|uniref:hypothetical protein n=1 Tax=Pseudonocardia sp. Ae150A_Ps1 TaxID=1885028 RepID=UPI0009F848B0|nr:MULTISPECIES: hypothetical protein [unclassified Pseudonocardia]